MHVQFTLLHFQVFAQREKYFVRCFREEDAKSNSMVVPWVVHVCTKTGSLAVAREIKNAADNLFVLIAL
jgi:hypothetical protein